MTSKELKRLRRTDLMEMLLELSKENVELRRQLDEANAKLADRQIQVENAGSLAEAALQLNGIFAAAQAACEQYEYRQSCAARHERCYKNCYYTAAVALYGACGHDGGNVASESHQHGDK